MNFSEITSLYGDATLTAVHVLIARQSFTRAANQRTAGQAPGGAISARRAELDRNVHGLRGSPGSSTRPKLPDGQPGAVDGQRVEPARGPGGRRGGTGGQGGQ
jgi:hypothetical protein